MGTLFQNCKVWLGPTENDWADDLFVVDGIVAQRQETVEPLETIDLDGAFVIPSFRDGHSHPLFAARELSGLILRSNASPTEIVQQVSKFASENPSATWIDGGSFSPSILQRAGMGAEMLDAALADIPVVLHCDDRHSLWVNSAALRAANLESVSDHAAIPGIDRHADGRPTGILRDWEAMNLVMSQAPVSSPNSDLESLYLAEQTMMSQGIAQVQDAWVDETNAETYLLAASQNQLRINHNLAYRCTAENWQTAFDAARDLRGKLQVAGNDNVRLNAVKIFLDGSFGSGTASTFESEDNLMWRSPELLTAISAFHNAGFQIHLHAIGDRAVNQALNALEQLNSSGAWDTQQLPVITHCELIADSDVARFKKLGVIANVQPSWAQLDDALKSTLESLPVEARDRMFRFADLMNVGATVSFGSDWPVSFPDTFGWLHTAATRQTREGQPDGGWMPNQRLSRAQALLCATKNVALQLGCSNSGSLHAGQTADFFTTASDPLSSAHDRSSDLKVQRLYISGEQVFSKV